MVIFSDLSYCFQFVVNLLFILKTVSKYQTRGSLLASNGGVINE
jgi:hypothetical protein